MFVRDYVQVEVSLPEVVRELERGAEWLPNAARRAYEDAARLGSEVGRVGNGASADSEPGLVVGAARERAGSVVVALHWAGTGTPFAALEGDLAFSPIGDSRTDVALDASYRSPGAEDADLVQHLVEAAVRSLLLAISERLVGHRAEHA